MALLWQNPRAVEEVVGRLRRHVRGESRSAGATGRAARRAERGRRFTTRLLGQYLQRYYTRNESVGFFGPLTWGTFAGAPRMTLSVGPGLTDQQHVMFEDWAIHELGTVLSRRRDIRRHLPPAMAVGTTRMGRILLRRGGASRRLSPAEAAVLDLTDGRRTAAEIMAQIGAEDSALDVLDVLEALADDSVITWTFDVPVDLRPEAALARELAALPDARDTRDARDKLDELIATREEVGAAGTAGELAESLARADRTYTELTGQPANRSREQAEFGHRLFVGADRRAVDLTVGTQVLDELAGPLGLVLDSARWFCARIGAEADTWFAGAYRDLTPLFGPDNVPLDALIGRVDDRFWDAASCAHVRDELTARWERVLRPDPGARRMEYTTAELAGRAAEEFAAGPPAWYGGRHHSPDLMLAASGVDAVRRGDYLAVLGELHAGIVTADCHSMTMCAADPHTVVRRPAEAALEDGPPRFVPLHHRAPGGPTGFDYPPPETFSPRYTYLSFGERTGARKPPVEPVLAREVTVGQTDGDGLTARLPDGRRLPLLTVLGEYLIFQTGSGFRVLPDLPHTPRITVDRLVVARERWRTPVGHLVPRPDMSARERYARVREVAEEIGLPRHSFWRYAGGGQGKPGTGQGKPLYLDTHSPLLTHVLVDTLTKGTTAGGTVTFSEMLPDPDGLWLPDAAGRRYTSELRITVADGADGADG
ncbi:lantibiotic dehydratase [Streptomyces sp. NPDC058665]|uniref:lantibiotic dehydratase n=1 Tax=Streptomyces sp. NPDC058665 TaxID=3346586 RepID=UPI0036521F25